MSSPTHDSLSSYVLGELSEDERRAFERQMGADPALAQEARELRALVARVETVDTAAFEHVAPPPLRLDAGAAPAPAAAPAKASRRERERGPGFFARLLGAGMRQPALAAALLALVFVGGLGVGVLVSGDSGEEPLSASGTPVTLAPVGDLQPAASGDAQLVADGRELRVSMSGLDPSNDDDFYEAWLLDGKQGLVSLGSFRVGADGQATLDVPVPVDPAAFPVVDISIEPADGAPGHSGKSVLRAELT